MEEPPQRDRDASPEVDRGSVRLRVVVVTDIAGSTTLRARLGEQQATEAFRMLEQVTEEVVAAHGGRVVKHLGDGSLAAFESATAAVDASRAVQAASVGMRTSMRGLEDLSLRVGVSAGDVDLVGGDIAGMAVVVASRLCDRAEDGDILADRQVLDLTWGRLDAEVGDAPDALDLKGCPRPVEAVRVPWAPPAIDLPLPPMIERSLAAEFVGRRRDLEVLNHAAQQVREGASALVSIAGEAGMGKSSLLARFARGMADEGAQVLAGACIEGPQVPFDAWAHALGEFAGRLSLPALATACRGDAEVLARLAPQIGERLALSGGDAVETPQRLHEAVAGFLNRRAADGPVVVILDDLHWAGEDSAQMLRGVIQAVEGPVLIVLSHRDTDVSGDHPWIAALHDAARAMPVTEHRLVGLTADELRELASVLRPAGSQLDSEELRRAESQGGGNPLLSRELLRIQAAPDGTVATAAAAVRRRVSQLPAETQRVLSVAALLGEQFDVSVLERVELGMDDEELLHELETARNAGLVEEVAGEPDRLVFMHGLVPEVLAEELSAMRRSRLHLRLAKALGPRADPAVLAHHYAASRLEAGLEPAIEHARRAAKIEAGALAYEQASETLARVLALVEEVDPTREDLAGWVQVELSNYRYLAGDIVGRRDAAARAGAIARHLDDVALLHHAAIGRAGFPQAGYPDSIAVELLEAALAATPAADVGARAELLSVLAYYRGINEGRREEADELARTAIAAARTTRSPRDLAEALAARSFLLTAAPGVGEHLAVCEELDSLAPLLEDRADRERHEQYVLRQRGPLWLRVADLERFADDLVRLDDIARSQRSWIAEATSAMWRGLLALASGDAEAAEQRYETMAEVGKGQANFAESFAFALFMVRRAQDRLDELLDLARVMMADTPELRSFEPAMAQIELANGNQTVAEEIWQMWAADGFERLPHDVTTSAALPLLTELCVRFGSTDDAAVLAGELDAYEGELLVVAWGICSMGAADRFRGMLSAHCSRFDEAAERFDAALALERTAGFPGLAAETAAARSAALD